MANKILFRKWDWEKISSHPNLKFSWVKNNLDWPWVWSEISISLDNYYDYELKHREYMAAFKIQKWWNKVNNKSNYNMSNDYLKSLGILIKDKKSDINTYDNDKDNKIINKSEDNYNGGNHSNNIEVNQNTGEHKLNEINYMNDIKRKNYINRINNFRSKLKQMIQQKSQIRKKSIKVNEPKPNLSLEVKKNLLVMKIKVMRKS